MGAVSAVRADLAHLRQTCEAVGLPDALREIVVESGLKLALSVCTEGRGTITAHVVVRAGTRGIAVVAHGPGTTLDEDLLQRTVSSLSRAIVEIQVDIRRGEAVRVRFEAFDSPVHAAPHVAIVGRGLVVPSGDDAVVLRTDAALWLVVIDGVGHGQPAHLAATTAVQALRDAFGSDPAQDPVRLCAELHRRVRHTRGVAATVARWRLADSQLVVCGLGNVACALYGPDGSRRTFSPTAGMLGRRGTTTPRVHEAVVPLGGAVAMATDGVVPGLATLAAVRRAPLRVAREWLESSLESRDDALVLVAR